VAILHLHRNGPADGNPLLAIHGVTAHGRRFDRLQADYLFDRHVVAPDLRGHGDSLREAPWNFETLVDDVVDTLDHLGWGQVDVMGHSLGGNIALRLLAAAPHRIKRLVLLDPVFLLPPATATANAVHAMTDQSFRSLDELIDARRTGRSEAAVPHSDEDTRIAAHQGPDRRWRMNFERAAVVAMWAELARPLPEPTETRPTLLVNALQAQLVQRAQIDWLENALEDDLTQVDLELGHMLYWDDLTTTGRIVAGFLND
jgi:lipase